MESQKLKVNEKNGIYRDAMCILILKCIVLLVGSSWYTEH